MLRNVYSIVLWLGLSVMMLSPAYGQSSSTVTGSVTDLTTATASPVSVVGNGSSAYLGGVAIQGSTVTGSVTNLTTATA